MHGGQKFGCSKCPKKYKTESNRPKHEKGCTRDPRSPARTASRTLSPAQGIGVPQTNQQHYTREPKDEPEDGSDKAASISNYWGGEESTASSREEADEPYSAKAKAKTTTKEV